MADELSPLDYLLHRGEVIARHGCDRLGREQAMAARMTLAQQKMREAKEVVDR